jgi:two-component system, cell cycle response regulator
MHRIVMAGKKATRVLGVDDAQVMRRAVEKMLESDYDVVLANDGEAGWEQLAQDNQIEMLITDIQMPLLDGYGLICRVRASDNAHIRDLPIITITGAEDDETRIRAYACGSTDFIIKPFNKKLLSSRVHAYLRLKQASLLHTTAATTNARTLDPLTRLGSLGAFLDAGKGFFQRSRESGRDLSVAALDIDDFPALQRQHGVAADQLLLRVAGLLMATIRREDVVARVGEAEFAVLIPDADRAQAMVLCERLRERIAAEPLSVAAGPIAISASFGLVTQSADAPETFEKFLVLVEQRLSQARSDGGNRVGVTLLSDVMPEPEEVVLSGAPDAELSLENARGEIELAEDSGDLSITELEALVRDETTRQKSGSRVA